VTGLRACLRLRNCASIPGRCKIYSLEHPLRFWGLTSWLFSGTGGAFLFGKAVGAWSSSFIVTSAEVKNGWTDILTLMCVFTACTGTTSPLANMLKFPYCNWSLLQHSVLTILMYVPCSLYSLLSRPTDRHTGNTNIGITPMRLSRLYMQPPNKQLPRVIIINVLLIVFYHSTTIRWTF
jgi:hypothetical protein